MRKYLTMIKLLKVIRLWYWKHCGYEVYNNVGFRKELRNNSDMVDWVIDEPDWEVFKRDNDIRIHPYRGSYSKQYGFIRDEWIEKGSKDNVWKNKACRHKSFTGQTHIECRYDDLMRQIGGKIKFRRYTGYDSDKLTLVTSVAVDDEKGYTASGVILSALKHPKVDWRDYLFDPEEIAMKNIGWSNIIITVDVCINKEVIETLEFNIEAVKVELK